MSESRRGHSGLRAKGLASIAEAGAVVLETNGELSVLRLKDLGPESVLRDVAGV